jgi:hypothetical protein
MLPSNCRQLKTNGWVEGFARGDTMPFIGYGLCKPHLERFANEFLPHAFFEASAVTRRWQ